MIPLNLLLHASLLESGMCSLTIVDALMKVELLLSSRGTVGVVQDHN